MHFLTEVFWSKGQKKQNEDTVVLQEAVIGRVKVVLAAVFDGIGGMEEGEKASGYLGERLVHWFHTEALPYIAKGKGRQAIRKAGIRFFYDCQEALLAYAKEKGHALGTTASVLLLWKNKYVLWHCGDSRIYHIKANGFERTVKQLTLDHTINGKYLVKGIGSFSWQEPDSAVGRCGSCDGFLLCTDGYWRRLNEQRIKEVFALGLIMKQEQLMRRLKELASFATRCGEMDNLSAVVVVQKKGGCYG